MKKTSTNSTAIILLYFEIKANRKVQNPQRTSGNKKARPYNSCARKFDLCLTEKLTMAKANPSSLLNTRDEFISKCSPTNNFFRKISKSAIYNSKS